MAMPTEASIYCSKCAIYNISPDNCFCDDCLQGIKEKYLDRFVKHIKYDHFGVTFCIDSIEMLAEQYKINKEEVENE